MELAAATHHSFPKGGWPDTTHNAPRGQDGELSWCAPWRPEGARGAVGGSHGRFRGCPGASPGGAVAVRRRRRGRHHRLLPPARDPQADVEGGGGGVREGDTGAQYQARPRLAALGG